MIIEALIAGAIVGVVIAVARYVPWFGPIALFVVVAFLGFGLMADLYAKYGHGDVLYFLAPAALFFGLGGPAALILKPFPGVKNYSAAVFCAACILSLYAVGKLVAYKVG